MTSASQVLRPPPSRAPDQSTAMAACTSTLRFWGIRRWMAVYRQGPRASDRPNGQDASDLTVPGEPAIATLEPTRRAMVSGSGLAQRAYLRRVGATARERWVGYIRRPGLPLRTFCQARAGFRNRPLTAAWQALRSHHLFGLALAGCEGGSRYELDR